MNKILMDNFIKYYDDIVNYDYEENDYISIKLINWYRKLVFSNYRTDMLYQLDYCLYLYISDMRFQKRLKRYLMVENICFNDQGLVISVIKRIIDYTNIYENDKILEISNTKWL